jgi:hypothetical protein
VRGVRQGNTDHTWLAAMQERVPRSPQLTSTLRVVPLGAVPLKALLVGAFDVFLLRGIDADDVSAVDEYWNLYD